MTPEEEARWGPCTLPEHPTRACCCMDCTRGRLTAELAEQGKPLGGTDEQRARAAFILREPMAAAAARLTTARPQAGNASVGWCLAIVLAYPCWWVGFDLIGPLVARWVLA